MLKITLIGYGEVGQILGADLKGKAEVHIYDINTSKLTKATHETVHKTLETAVNAGDIIMSAVTADNTVSVAKEASQFIKNQIYFDMNSAAPHTKQEAAKHIKNYVEAALMSPVKAPRIAIPILAGGLMAVETAQKLNSLGFKIEAISDKIGVASATKLCRSIVIKGLETLMVDCLKNSIHYDVVERVFASLDASYPSINWLDLAHDMKERVETHGVRRSAEMHEAADMVNHAGFNDGLVRAVAEAQLKGVKLK